MTRYVLSAVYCIKPTEIIISNSSRVRKTLPVTLNCANCQRKLLWKDISSPRAGGQSNWSSTFLSQLHWSTCACACLIMRGGRLLICDVSLLEKKKEVILLSYKQEKRKPENYWWQKQDESFRSMRTCGTRCWPRRANWESKDQLFRALFVSLKRRRNRLDNL